MSGLSTHVLDLALGRPAAGVAVTLKRDGVVIFADRTNLDGRCAAMLGDRPLERGAYQLVFEVADYFAAAHAGAQGAPFFPLVTLDFTVSDPAVHHHVPLLLSPFGYSTYRGS